MKRFLFTTHQHQRGFFVTSLSQSPIERQQEFTRMVNSFVFTWSLAHHKCKQIHIDMCELKYPVQSSTASSMHIYRTAAFRMLALEGACRRLAHRKTVGRMFVQRVKSSCSAQQCVEARSYSSASHARAW